MEKLKEEIIKELKNAILDSETRILSKIELVNEKVKKLEEENKELRGRVEYLERGSKKKNLVAFGLVENREEVNPDNVCNKLNKLLDINIKSSDIGDLNLIGGNSGKEPLRIEFVSKFSKVNVLSNCKKLKGKKITITQDLTKLQQARNKILRDHLKQIRSVSQDNCYIKGEKLYRNNKVYTVEDIIEIGEDFIQQSNSAPQIPTADENLEVEEKTLSERRQQERHLRERKPSNSEAIKHQKNSALNRVPKK